MMSKKLFPCGHSGKGQYCHRCKQDESVRADLASLRQNRTDWKQLFLDDVVDLRPLTHKRLVTKARAILLGIRQGHTHREYQGKRLRYDRNIVSIPVNHDYRLLLHFEGKQLVPHKLMSHEEYNIRRPGEIH
jgi:hypothetical protein